MTLGDGSTDEQSERERYIADWHAWKGAQSPAKYRCAHELRSILRYAEREIAKALGDRKDLKAKPPDPDGKNKAWTDGWLVGTEVMRMKLACLLQEITGERTA